MYRIIITAQALRQVTRLPKNIVGQIKEKLNDIAVDPFAPHPNVKRMKGIKAFRLRVGDWRVIYEVKTNEVVIIVINVGHRKEVYR